MPVTYILDFANGSTEAYDAVIERMQLGGRLPAGALFHCVGRTDTGMRVMDVWENSDVFQRFAQEKIAPLSAEQGLAPPEIRRLEVAQLRRGEDEDVSFAQLVLLPGVDGATFTEMDARVLGPAGFPPDGCVFHVNGPTDDGYYVMDAWASKAQRDRFLDENIMPAVQASGLDVKPEMIDLELHNSLRHSATTGAAA